MCYLPSTARASDSGLCVRLSGHSGPMLFINVGYVRMFGKIRKKSTKTELPADCFRGTARHSMLYKNRMSVNRKLQTGTHQEMR